MILNNNRDSETRVKRPFAISPLPTDFDKFLYAPISEFNDELPSSVLSALARQNLDPWEEAAKLSQLPRESAILRLTPMIFAITTEPPASLAPAATAARLVALLPRSNGFNFQSFDKLPCETPRNFAPIIIYLFVGAIILASALL